MASKFYGDPAKKLQMIGITGTKGKTTTSYLIRHLLEEMKVPSGLMGTVEILSKNFHSFSKLTTQDVIFNHKMLHQMGKEGCKACVMEVSSHGLSQRRVDEISFDVAIFTNLHSDHLDYHKTLEEYISAKQKLFHQCQGVVIVNADSPFSSFMQGGKKRYEVGIEKGDLRAQEMQILQEGISFSIEGVLFHIPLLGRFNVYNALSSIAFGIDQGWSLSSISSCLRTFQGVPGRLQSIPNQKGITILVDYAHTGESLQSVLATLKSFAKRKIIVVFGAGGGRDPARRKQMGEAAGLYADVSIITTDNPRKEDPQTICQQILEGFSSSQEVVLEMDRKKAIEKAIHLAQEQDIVLIAGKGHEKMQIFADRTIHFDDVLVVKECLMR
jgi:UDP-N-acetylmuramoyl-L-alanyl-D-glutamate--2,6-diaminopimelate ligase